MSFIYYFELQNKKIIKNIEEINCYNIKKIIDTKTFVELQYFDYNILEEFHKEGFIIEQNEKYILFVTIFERDISYSLINKEIIKNIKIDKTIFNTNVKNSFFNMEAKTKIIKNYSIFSNLPDEILDIILKKSLLFDLSKYKHILNQNLEFILNELKILELPLKLYLNQNNCFIIDNNYKINDKTLFYVGKSKNVDKDEIIRKSNIVINLEDIKIINFYDEYFENLYIDDLISKEYIKNNSIDFNDNLEFGNYYKISSYKYDELNDFDEDGFFIKRIGDFYLFETVVYYNENLVNYLLLNKKYIKKILLIKNKYINTKYNYNFDNIFSLDFLKDEIVTVHKGYSINELDDIMFTCKVNFIENIDDMEYLNVSKINLNSIYSESRDFKFNYIRFIKFDDCYKKFRKPDLNLTLIKNIYYEYITLEQYIFNAIILKYYEYKIFNIIAIRKLCNNSENYLVVDIDNFTYLVRFKFCYDLNGNIDFKSIKKIFIHDNQSDNFSNEIVITELGIYQEYSDSENDEMSTGTSDNNDNIDNNDIENFNSIFIQN